MAAPERNNKEPIHFGLRLTTSYKAAAIFGSVTCHTALSRPSTKRNRIPPALNLYPLFLSYLLFINFLTNPLDLPRFYLLHSPSTHCHYIITHFRR